MNKIIAIEQAIKVSHKLKMQNKSIVLAGGCFDILHTGHMEFLRRAKLHGDVLFVMLESDETIKRLKGNQRPLNNQQHRANVLSSLESVDYIIMLMPLKNDDEYDKVVVNLKPDILATTKNDKFLKHKKRQAEKIGAKVVSVIKRIPDTSTTNLLSTFKQGV